MRFYDYALRFKDTGGTSALQRLQRAAGGVRDTIGKAGEKARSVMARMRGDVAGAANSTSSLKSAFERAAQAGESAFGRMRTALGRFRRDADASASKGTGGPGGGMGILGGAKSLIGGLAIGAAAYGLVGAVRDTATVQGMDNAIRFSGGVEGARNLEFVDKTADRLGLNLLSAKDGFKTLAGSMMGTKLAGEGTRKLFEQVAGATTVMGLSGDDQKGVFLALGQIMSKGKVAAEELRGQIGERLPGAFKIAADAMGVTQAQLNKLMQDGKVTSADFLPKFGAQLDKVFGSGLGKATNSLQANLNRFDSLWERTKTGLVTNILPGVLLVMSSVTEMASNLEPLKNALRLSWEALRPLRDAFQRTAEALGLTGDKGKVAAGVMEKIGQVITRLSPVIRAVARVAGTLLETVVRIGKALFERLNSWHIFDGIIFGISFVSRYLSRVAGGWGKIISGALNGSFKEIKSGVREAFSAGDYVDIYRKTQKEIAGDKAAKARQTQVDKTSAAKNLLDKGANEKGLSLGSNPDLAGAVNSASGAGQVRNVTVNIAKQVENLTIQTTELKESANQVVGNLQEWLVRAVAGAEMVLN